MPHEPLAVRRDRTAITRRGLSAPIKCALADGLIGPAVSVLDYGCGHGEDVARLTAQGVRCDGWDPAFRLGSLPRESDVVNLGYVINVIEDPAERSKTLHRAWALCRQVLVVAAQVRVPGRGAGHVQFGDGVLTTRGTFQKFFEQSELRAYLEGELRVEAVPATVGVFYAFRDGARREQFLADRFRRRPAGPRVRMSDERFERHRPLLQPFVEVLAQLGRVPGPEEYPEAGQVCAAFGSLPRAFALVRRVTGESGWAELARRRRDDLLVFLALSRFRKRPRLADLPRTLQYDIRAFLGPYTKACDEADRLLRLAGDPDAVSSACERSKVGKLLPNALYVHRTALEALEPLLRIYEGCARAYIGEVAGANLVKLHRFSGKVSYLAYPAFDTDPHPALLRSVKLSLRTRELDCQDYSASDSPPILHRKEAFLLPDHPSRERFARLTRQEEHYGLLDDASGIGTRAAWQRRLDTLGFAVRGHRLVRRRAGPQAPTEGLPD